MIDQNLKSIDLSSDNERSQRVRCCLPSLLTDDRSRKSNRIDSNDEDDIPLRYDWTIDMTVEFQYPVNLKEGVL